MIKLHCDDELFFNIFTNLFEQKNLVNKVKSDQYFVNVNIKINLNKVNIDVNGNISILQLPLDVNHFFNYILKLISHVKLSLNEYEYFPYRRILSGKNSKSFLSDIQNTIISNLISSSKGINKDLLYSLIWRKDKEVSINKLDTHLTNLKNQLKKDLNMRINFHSHEKILKLVID